MAAPHGIVKARPRKCLNLERPVASCFAVEEDVITSDVLAAHRIASRVIRVTEELPVFISIRINAFGTPGHRPSEDTIQHVRCNTRDDARIV